MQGGNLMDSTKTNRNRTYSNKETDRFKMLFETSIFT